MLMPRTRLLSKIRRAGVRHCELNPEGLCVIDENLLDAAANLGDNEHVHIGNINQGERFITFGLRPRTRQPHHVGQRFGGAARGR